MVPGPEGDHFDPSWLHVALPALLRDRARARRTVRLGLDVDGARLLLTAGRSGFSLSSSPELDGHEPDATLRTSAHVLLGLAAHALSLDDARALGAVEVEGDDSALRTALGLALDAEG